MSAEVEQYVMTEAEAHQVTEDIRHNAKSFTEYRARMMQAVERAKVGSAHVALGYKSWQAYLSEVLGEEPMRLARDERQDMVRMLSDEGMSTRAIAPIVGASKSQVAEDKRGVQNWTPDPAPHFVDTTTGEIHDDYRASIVKAEEEVVEQARKVQGMDGKTYSRPEPVEQPRRRPSLIDDARSANTDLWKAVERIRSIMRDDRFTKNKADVRDALHPSADLAKEILSDLFN